MRIYRIRIENYGPFEILEECKVGNLATFIGKNDVGKSHILRALNVFFDNSKLQEQNVYAAASITDDVVIEVAFDEIPNQIELGSSISTTFQEEHLLDENGLLRVRKTYPRNNLGKPRIALITHDLYDDQYAGLPVLKEQKLNTLCTSLGISVSRSGAGITNKSKREAIRGHASNQNMQKVIRELELGSDDVLKLIKSIMPEFVFFKADTPLGLGQSNVQSWFRPFIKAAFEDADVSDIRNEFENKMCISLQEEVDKIHERLSRHTDAFSVLSANPSFQWDKAVSVDITGEDAHGTKTHLEDRGSGIQRLVMVSYFEYVAEEKRVGEKDIVYAIEEPENCLHPGLQRELIQSFRDMIEEGFQILLTSHSPVFAGASPIEDLTLIKRERGAAYAVQFPQLSLEEVASELGVGPSDQLFGYNALVFVEGPDDESFFRKVASLLKEASELSLDFDDVNVGFVITGGDNLKHWVDRNVMRKLNPQFCVIVDSDKTSPTDQISQKKIQWQQECERNGGAFLILRKRAIENYIHPDALSRRGITYTPYDDYTHMKDHIGRKDVWKTIFNMTASELLQMDEYSEDGQSHNEIKEIVEKLLSLE